MKHLCIAPLFVVALAGAQVPSDDVVARIKDEGLQRSQVASTLSHLCDVIGPRLTASPRMKLANEWTRDTMVKWGLANARLEAWGPFGRGWELERFQAQVVSPQCIPLIAYPKAWSPGKSVNGAELVLVESKTEEELSLLKGKLKGKVVLNGGTREVAAHFKPEATRLADGELAEMAAGPAPRRTTDTAARPPRRPAGPQATIGARMRFFAQEGVAMVLESARGDGGTIFVQSAAVVPPPAPPAPGTPAPATAGGQRRGLAPWDPSGPATLPQVAVSSEQYNRLVRMAQQGERLKLDIDLRVKFTSQDLMGYNTFAELPGTDLKDQLVMVGGHMDSWHAGTGATDNAAGVSVAMEAVRILKAAGLRPRRTVRVALWSGEEQGLIGSRAYAKQHLGEFVQGADGAGRTLKKGPEWDKVSAYFNLDNGTGKIRGVYAQGNQGVVPIFTEWLKPFADMGASTVTIRTTGGTDHLAFDAVGVPGFQFIQDEIEYDTRTHHSNQDVFDRVQIDDMKQAAVVMATFIYQAANRDEMLPRKAVK